MLDLGCFMLVVLCIFVDGLSLVGGLVELVGLWGI